MKTIARKYGDSVNSVSLDDLKNNRFLRRFFMISMTMLINNQLTYCNQIIMPKNFPYWFIRDGEKLIQCSKNDFDKAIICGKSVKYGAYANKKCERIADELEASRMEFLSKPDLSPKFKAAITNPRNVVEVQVILVDDPQFWIRESKRPKYISDCEK